MSSLTWLDYSEAQRRRALEFIDTFAERDTRDELGIGVIRDTFSELMFPGTSTVQTRARYFLFVPWMYLKAEAYARRAPRTAEAMATQCRYLEVSLIAPIGRSDDSDGLFGREARDGLKQLPSAIYWQGLETWGIRRFSGPRAQLHGELARRAGTTPVVEFRDPDEEPRSAQGLSAHWDPHLPPCPPNIWENASFRLLHHEAEYLRDRLMATLPETLLTSLVEAGVVTDVSAPWFHPLCGQFHPNHEEQLAHARAFSLAIRGAAVLYNLMLAEEKARASDGAETLVHSYRKEFSAWTDEMSHAEDELASWDRLRFWDIVLSHGARVGRTKTFVDQWLDHALAGPAQLADDGRARELVRRREVTLKGGLARLTNRRALELWSEASGMQRLNYRWSTVQTMVTDILRGLEEPDALPV
ncbi:MAG: DUF6361 family protein [Thermoleophilia bacterium]